MSYDWPRDSPWPDREDLSCRSYRRQHAGISGSAFVVAVVLLAVPLQSALALGGGSGSISLTTLGSAYTQDFDTLANTGTANNLAINGWYLNELGTSASNNGQYTTGTGSGTGGDVYSFGATGVTERAFGTLLSGTLAPTIGAQFTNNTGSTVTGLEISYSVRCGASARAPPAEPLTSSTSSSAPMRRA